MKRFILSFCLLLGIIAATAQPATLPKDAQVEGTIVSMRHKRPLNNELIVFKSGKNGNEFQAVSDASGNFSTRLPAGDKYEIFILGFKDSTSYNFIDIPALGKNEFYKKPFTVNIEHQAAKTFIVSNVEFDFGKATLRPESYAILDELVGYLERQSERIEIGGHTDNVGTKQKNMQLSLDRAQSVVDYLVSKGVDKDKIFAKGYGFADPLEDNKTEAGRQKNRRIEVKFIDTDDKQ